MIYKTHVGKEDFKRAYTTCLKEAWILHSKENFNMAKKFYDEKLFQYNIDQTIDDEADFNDDASAINLFEAFKQAFETEKDIESLEKWNKAWEAEDGFDFEVYAGDSIVDGNEVGEKARELFDLKLFNYNEKHNTNLQSLDLGYLTFKDALKRTKEVFKDANKLSQYKYMYEPAFEFDNSNLRTRCDILEILDNNRVNIYEVKGTTKIKPDHFFDLAYQIFVLEKNGLKVNKIFLTHLNPEYVYGWKQSVDMKELGNDVAEKYKDVTYEEVLDYIKENNLLEPFTNEAEEDVDLEKLFILDENFKEPKGKEPITLKQAYQMLNSTHPMNTLISNLAEKLAMSNEEQVKSLFKQKTCMTKMSFTPKNGWNYGEAKDYLEPYCYHVVPYYDATKDTIFNLTGSSAFSNRDKAELVRESGIVYLSDLVHTNLSTLPEKAGAKGTFKPFLRPEHDRILDVYRAYTDNGNVGFDEILDTNHLNEIYYVLSEYKEAQKIYMYDFETVKFAVPRFWISKSYQQIPFQYSVDVIYDDKYDYNHPETMYHDDFLPKDKRSDPRPDFIVKFLNDMLLKYGEGVYVAYNKSFEKSVLKYLAVNFPKYALPLCYIANHTIDLMDFFKGKQANKKIENDNNREWFLIYHPDFHGSYSIKKTQPALEPEFNYHDLIINKGDKAAQTFRQFVTGDLTDKQWETIWPAMLKYCNRDTLAMVVILKRVEEMLKEYEEEKRNNE
ncbi:DUF2779 domain-containing protein [Mesoplasma lactucae]|uniref:Uncharacterized protein n=1 Tax=Mesoplasma lactucae ATCC 49193 TaxID=81460 RepID=A0A291IRC1_9MOLU|nr:DUF2779 domain-containing protein [Mesoplasma lactucae]ATG97339.1 hypothetical protein CP520_01025 [Mesoplasma lactucae ATCC 49193]ATZ20209.1 hypothetical protein MLACT_v1c03880 [Mesoplasma lactucae ATCC 49193]MCL8216958.1 hypothetical protein [Mesoplasma lactucae ATCC 49193]